MAKKQRKAAEVTIDINANVASLAKDMKKVTGELDALSRKVSQTNSTLQGLFTIEAARSAISVFQTIASTIGQIADKGDKAQSVLDAFGRLGGNQQQIKAASDAVLGMVGAYDLMNIANEAMLRQVPGVMDNFGKIADLGARVATVLNTDTKGGIEAVTAALESGKIKQLQAVGIQVDAIKAYEDYGAAIGKAGDKLNEAQQKEAVQIAAIQNLDEALGRIPPTADSVNNSFVSLQTSLGDALAEFSRAINENDELKDAFRRLQEGVEAIDWYAVGQGISHVITEMSSLFAILAKPVDGLITLIQNIQTVGTAFEIAALKGEQFALRARSALNVRNPQTMIADAIGVDFMDSAGKRDATNAAQADIDKRIKDVAGKIQAKTFELAFGPILTSGGGGGQSTGTSVPTPQKGDSAEDRLQAGREAAEEYRKAVEKLNESLRKTEQGQLKQDLQEQMDAALEAGEWDVYEKLGTAMANVVRDDFVANMTDGIQLSGEDYARVMIAAEQEVAAERRRQQKAEEAAKERARRLEEQRQQETADELARGVTDIGNVFGVDLSRAMTIASQNFQEEMTSIADFFGEQLGITGKEFGGYMQAAATVFSNIMNAKGLDKSTKSNRGTGGAAGSGIGAAVGGYFGGAAGAQFGAEIGNIIGQEIGAMFKWGAQNANTQARHAFANWIEEQLSQLQAVTLMDRNGRFVTTSGSAMNFIEGDSSRFNTPGWANEMDAWGANARNMFDGLGHALKGLLGITDKVGGQIAYLLGQNLAGNIDNARLLVYQLGLSIEDLSEALLKMALTGEITWQQYASFAAGLEEAFKPGLKAVNDMTGAMNEFYGSGGRGRAALKGFLDIIQEAIDGGAKTVDDLRAHLIKGGMSAEDADAFINVLKANGVKMLSEVKNMTDAQLGTIVAGLGNSIDAINKKWQEVGKTFEKMKWDLDNLPTEKDIKVRFTGEFDENMNKADRAGLLDGSNSKLQPVDSSGVSVKSFGVSGAQQSGAVRTMSATGSVKASSYTIQIDARNADAGVEDRIRNVITSYGDAIAQQAANIVMDNQVRGA